MTNFLRLINSPRLVKSRRSCLFISRLLFACSALHLSAAAIGVAQGENNYRVGVYLCKAIAFGIAPMLYFCKPRRCSQQVACVVGMIASQPIFLFSDWIKAEALINGVDANTPFF